MSNWWNVVIHAIQRDRDVVVAPHMMDADDRSKKAVITTAEWVSNPMFGSPRRINFDELEEYEYDITVQAATNYIVDSVATCEWDIIRDEDMVEDDEEVDNADAKKFFESKEWDESFDIVRRGIVADTLLYDSGVLVLTFPEYCYDENKTLIKTDVVPLQLRARDGRSFIKQVDIHGDIMRYWQYSFLHTAAKPVEFDKEEIIYIQERPSTRSPYGTSKLEVVKNVADLMMATQVGHRSEQENSLQLGGIISHPDITDVEKLKRLSALYNANNKGERNKGRWLVTGGSVEATPVDASVGDDSWISGSDFYQQQILSIFKVPKTVLGFTSSDTNRATAISQTTNFKRLGVSTMLSLLENIFTRDIVKKYFNEKLCFRFKREVDLTDEAIRADIDAKNVATGIRTTNELRARDGLEEIEEQTSGSLEEGGEVGGEDAAEGDDKKTPEEKTEKAVNTTKLEDEAFKDLQDLSREDEKEVLAELRALYGE